MIDHDFCRLASGCWLPVFIITLHCCCGMWIQEKAATLCLRNGLLLRRRMARWNERSWPLTEVLGSIRYTDYDWVL